ncbi:hypothetical protein Ciccas_006340 [Cichlidogyrus casuarinus]|uniref:Uncharacterized protein n=1 Tax=Cichlidogyrus casuarinus TaxID=1844966 RepID=A0ABD2Q619_9PLAT
MNAIHFCSMVQSRNLKSRIARRKINDRTKDEKNAIPLLMSSKYVNKLLTVCPIKIKLSSLRLCSKSADRKMSSEPSRKFSVEPAIQLNDKEDFTVVSASNEKTILVQSRKLLIKHRAFDLAGDSPTQFHEDDLYNDSDDDDPTKVDIYENEYHTRPPMSSMFSQLSSYTGGIQPSTDETTGKGKSKKPAAKLGTILGVCLPCIQNIFGVLLFLRMSWISGVAGGLNAFLIVFICCCTTFLTALSMSAIATNGKVPAGGSYFMISRSIGPEFGGAVGLLFYIGTTIASAMYIIGAVEVFLTYICPAAAIGGDLSEARVLFNNTRLYGTCLLILLTCCVFIGIQFVSKFATISLAAVLLSILSIFVGFFISGEWRSTTACSIGGRVLSRSFVQNSTGHFICNKNETAPLFQLYCNSSVSDEASCTFFHESEVEEFYAVPGLASGKFFQNVLASNFREIGQTYDNVTFPARPELGQKPNLADISTSFVLLLAIYFPSVTGIMAGSNRSGDLANPQVAIPRGTIAAIVLTSIISLACFCFLLLLTVESFGTKATGGSMMVGLIGWPHNYVILTGSLLSTIGAGLQSLTGAPRLLQAIAQDGILPFLQVFARTTKRGEPFLAQLLTFCISLMGVLIASLDSITPLDTLSAGLEFLHRPHVHIELDLRSEWGDATRGLQLTAARSAILRLGTKPMHTKNWRPQILIYLPVDEKNHIYHNRLLDLAHQLKAGKGLTLVTTVIQGDIFEGQSKSAEVKDELHELLRDKRIKGLPEVIISKEIAEGMLNMAQCAGLGNLRHNTIMVSFPAWRNKDNRACSLAMIVPKNIDHFPRAKDRLSGTIDAWSVVQDGGLLILIAYLLLRSRAWSHCKLRVFLVATESNNNVELKKAMSTFLFDLRIPAMVDVVEMAQADISAYAAQRTIGIKNREQMLQEMNLKNVAEKSDIQTILDRHHKESSAGTAEEASSNQESPQKAALETKAEQPIVTITPSDDSDGKSLAVTGGRSGGSSVTFAAGPGPAAMARDANEQTGSFFVQSLFPHRACSI